MLENSLLGEISKISPHSRHVQNSLNNNFNPIEEYSPLSSNNKNNIGFIAESGEIQSIDEMVMYAEHQIDIIYMDDINNIRILPFRLEMEKQIGSIIYVKEMNSLFFITVFGEMYEIKL